MSGAPAPAPAAPPTAIPAGLKRADITRFAHRAAQLQNFRPVISYWCRYHILEQILAAKLHTQDEECLQYTTALMDELESFKAQNAQNDAVTDDVASQAYVEQFAHETFNRAETAMRADKATVTTADTFQAAATFFELLSIWGTPDPEIAAKVKFAKYHALRIARALKAGEDPNLTNPKPAVDNKEDEAENGEQDGQAAVHLSAEDPDVQAIMGPPQVPSTTLPLRGAAAAAAAQDSSAQGKPTSGGSGGGDSDTASGAGGATPPVRLPGVMDIDEPHPAQSKNMERKPSAGIIPDLPAAPSEFATPTVSPGPTSGRDAGGRAAPLTGMPSIINPLNDNTTGKNW
ncbi:hypothetical protein KEM52_005155 [Ascosphaera acerosa]|nr:hypothetical protein KEM52_005155 [Ascosphaera acerosa]